MKFYILNEFLLLRFYYKRYSVQCSTFLPRTVQPSIKTDSSFNLSDWFFHLVILFSINIFIKCMSFFKAGWTLTQCLFFSAGTFVYIQAFIPSIIVLKSRPFAHICHVMFCTRKLFFNIQDYFGIRRILLGRNEKVVDGGVEVIVSPTKLVFIPQSSAWNIFVVYSIPPGLFLAVEYRIKMATIYIKF